MALITGGSGDLGSEIARALAAVGALTVVAARTEARLVRAAQAIRAEGKRADYVVCDLSDPSQIRRLATTVAERHGEVGVLVNNAIPTRGLPVFPLDEVDETAWGLDRRVILDAARLLSREVVPSMEKRGGGSIVHVGS